MNFAITFGVVPIVKGPMGCELQLLLSVTTRLYVPGLTLVKFCVVPTVVLEASFHV